MECNRGGLNTDTANECNRGGLNADTANECNKGGLDTDTANECNRGGLNAEMIFFRKDPLEKIMRAASDKLAQLLNLLETVREEVVPIHLWVPSLVLRGSWNDMGWLL